MRRGTQRPFCMTSAHKFKLLHIGTTLFFIKGYTQTSTEKGQNTPRRSVIESVDQNVKMPCRHFFSNTDERGMRSSVKTCVGRAVFSVGREPCLGPPTISLIMQTFCKTLN